MESVVAMKSLVDKLAEQSPLYRLPRTSAGHTRHYHPGASSIVFDSFLVVDREDELVVHWPDVELSAVEQALFDHILDGVSYLGRSESWASARRLDDDAFQPNCRPATHEERGTVVTVQVPMSSHDYDTWLEGFSAGTEHRLPLTGKNAVRVPESLWDALVMDTNQLAKGGWSRAPGSRDIRYVIAEEDRRSPSLRHHIRPTPEPRTMARFVLAGTPLPLVRNAVLIGDLFRKALMGKFPGEGAPPSELTGHDGNKPAKGHRHGYFLPEDEDMDGYIDHLLVYIPSGISLEIEAAMESLKRLRAFGFEWRVLFEGIGTAEDFKEVSSLVRPSCVWSSVTPYLHPWHRKKHGKFDAGDQLQKEINLLGRFSSPTEITSLLTISVAGHNLMPIQFRRVRRNHRVGPDASGSFWRLTFAEPVLGPIGLGLESHYGLGMFRAME